MPRIARIPTALGIALLIPQLLLPALAASPVWKVEKAGQSFYLGGTLHLLTPSDYPLPDAFHQAYQRSERIVFETDIDAMKTPEGQARLVQLLSFEDGTRLDSVISDDTYQAVKAFFEQRGVPFDQISRYKPGMVSILMTVIELKRIGVTTVGVDNYYNDRAIEDGKARGYLETVAQQLDFIANMGKGREDEMLRYSLKETGQLTEQWQALKFTWREGDLDQLEAMAAKPLQDRFPEVYDAMLVTRNRAWLPQIEAMAQTAETELILVGALHLAGKDGLLSMLEERGYRITALP